MIYIDLYYCVRDLQKCRTPRPRLNGENQNSDSTVKWKELSNVESTMPNGVNERKPVGYNQWN